MKKIILISLFIIQAFVLSAFVTVRVKDVSNIRGIRANQLVGYGLVTGLSGQGDSSRSILTKTTLAALLKNLGMNIDKESLQSQNSAVVMVTHDHSLVEGVADLEVEFEVTRKSLNKTLATTSVRSIPQD